MWAIIRGYLLKQSANKTYTYYTDQISSSPNRASLTSFNPFTHAASPVKSTSSFLNEETASGFQYASSIEDFLNPGAVADDEDSPFQKHHYPYEPQEHYPSFTTSSSTHSEYHIRLPEGGTINLGNFFNTPAGRGNSSHFARDQPHPAISSLQINQRQATTSHKRVPLARGQVLQSAGKRLSLVKLRRCIC